MSMSLTRRSLIRRSTVVAAMITAGLATGGLMSAAEAAGSVSVQQGKLVVSGGSEANAFFVTGNGGGTFTVTDASGVAISAGSGCQKTGSTSVRCTGVTTSIAVATGSGNDAVRLRSTNLESDIRGGTGNDVLIGSSSARDFIFGDSGDDSLSGSGNDFLNGGADFDKCSGVSSSGKAQCES